MTETADQRGMFDLASFSLENVAEASEAIRTIAPEASAMEEAAQAVVEYLYENLLDEFGKPACPLVRLYKTHEFGALEPELQEFAVRAGGEHEIAAWTRCFTLLGTAGHEEAWRSRQHSTGHRAIPLTSAAMVERLPMIAQLFKQLGIDIGVVVDPSGHDLVNLSQRAYDVFHVEEAVGSPYIPAQEDFVLRYGLRSAVGFGGVLYSGDLYAVILFSAIPVSMTVARRLKILALPLRVPLLRFLRSRVFAGV